MRGQDRAAAQKVAQRHPARTVAQLRRSWLAGRELGEINCAGARGPNTEK